MVVKTAKQAAITGISKENPVIGTIAAKANEKHETKVAARKEKVQQRKAENLSDTSPSPKTTGKIPAKPKAGKSISIGKTFSSKVAGKNLLLGELTLCLVILVMGTIVAPQGSDDGVHRMMIKGSALMAVFFILAIMSTGGKGPQKVASSLGMLIALSYLLTSSDVRNVMAWSKNYFTSANAATVTPKSNETVQGSTTTPPPSAIYV